jgi:signal transduction histidine kinase
MRTLIQDLIAYSKINAPERNFEKIDPVIIINEVIQEMDESIQQKKAVIKVNVKCSLDIIPFQFRQLLYNLASNSLKFSNPEHPPLIKIKSEIVKGEKLEDLKFSHDKNYCHIRVSDNGIGFEQQFSDKIFELFQRLHGKAEYNGTGIGLAIVKKIVENHNGIISANAEINKGATFDIYIPAS